MPSKPAPTFSARKSGKVYRSPVVESSKLVEEPMVDDKVKNKSAMRSVIWFLAMVILALLTYMGLKAYLGTEEVEVVQDTPVPTLVETDSIVNINTLPDDPVAPFSDTTFWNLESKQIQGTSEDVEFAINSIEVQPHTSYLSFIYEIQGGELSDFPQTTSELLSDINLNIESIAQNNSKISVDQQIEINMEPVKSFSRINYEDDVDSYMVSLIEKEPFALYSKVVGAKKFIILDILKGDNDSETPTDAVAPTAAISPTPVTEGTEVMDNEYSKNEQKIVVSTTGNISKITKYNYFDATDRFTYKLIFEGVLANATASLSDNLLTLTVSNLAMDGVVGNGGSGSTDLAATGVSKVKNVEITNSNGVSTYVFTLDTARDFKLTADKTESAITLEIKNQ